MPTGQVQPGVGSLGNCQLNGVDLQVVPGSWKVEEAPNFGEKVQSGSLKYSDFSSYISAHSVSILDGGYGIRRYSDVEDESTVTTCYAESSGVDCRFGPSILSPLLTGITLSGSSGTPVFIAEFTPSSGAVTLPALVTIAGPNVFYSLNGTSFTNAGITLSATPLPQAVGVFGGTIVIGYGAAATAQALISLDPAVPLTGVQDVSSNNLFVYAYTSDKASNFIAGGATTTSTNIVVSSVSAATGYSLPAAGVVCGGTDSTITALVPGGGVATLFVSRTKEFGEIDNNNNYRALVPFDTHLPTNGVGARFYLATGSEALRGPNVIVFPQGESGLMSYAPSTQDAGQSTDLSPDARKGFNPINATGRVTALQGTAHFLYYAITSATGFWIIARDSNTGASHTLEFLGNNTCTALGISSLFTTFPIMYAGFGNNLRSWNLPAHGSFPPDDTTNCKYTATGTLLIPDIDLGFPDEQKIAFFIRLVADNLSGNQTIAVSFAIDGGTSYTSLGTANSGPEFTFDFPTQTSFRRISLLLTFATTDPTKTPILQGLSVRVSLNPTLYRIWSFDAIVPPGLMNIGTPSGSNPMNVINGFWTARSAGFPVTFVDRWNATNQVRILHMGEQEVIQEAQRSPETRIPFQLLEVTNTPGTNVYGGALMMYDNPTSLYS